MFLEGWGGVWFACKSTGDSTGGRAHNPLPLCVSTIVVAGERSVLLSGDDEEGEAHPHLSQPLLYQLSNTATVECQCFQLETVFVGDSLARAACRGRLPCSREAQCGDQARDGAVATCPKKRRVGKPSSDEQYTRALCDWVATLVEPLETLPQAKRPG